MKHRPLAMQLNVGQHNDPMVPVREHHQNRVGTAKLKLNHTPCH